MRALAISASVARNFIQPLTAIRTAADIVQEAAISSDAIEGVHIILENVDKLHRQTQEFRKLALLREGSVETVRLDEFIEHAIDVLAVAIQNRRLTVNRQFETDGECVLLNGTTLARTFLDLILDAVRSVEPGAEIVLALRGTDAEHLAFEMRYESASTNSLTSLASLNSALGAREKGNPGLQLAQRTVHSCGGNLTFDLEDGRRARLRIVLPRNATRVATHRERAPVTYQGLSPANWTKNAPDHGGMVIVLDTDPAYAGRSKKG